MTLHERILLTAAGIATVFYFLVGTYALWAVGSVVATFEALRLLVALADRIDQWGRRTQPRWIVPEYETSHVVQLDGRRAS